MTKKLLTFIIALVLCFVPMKAWAADEIVDGIWEYEFEQANASDGESYLKLGLVPFAGHGGEWLTICLHQYDNSFSYDAYLAAMREYMAENELKTTDYMRNGLCMAELNADRKQIIALIQDNTEYDKIMSLIYGLMLCKEIGYDREYAADTFATRIVNMVNPDGGWSLTPGASDADVTAMALNSLSYLREEYSQVIDKALSYLSGIQAENGGFKSYGIENSESTSQVIMALEALDIDIENDERFIKNGRNLWEVLLEYRCEDGGYAHTIGGPSNKMATVQALQAYMCEYEAEIPEEPESTVQENTTQSVTTQETLNDNFWTGKLIRRIMQGVIALIWLIALILLVIRRKINWSKGITITVVAAALVVGLNFVKIETVAEHNNRVLEKGEIITYITIKGYEDMVMPRREIMISDNDTAFIQLQRALAINNLPMSYTGSVALGNVYVSSIAGLAEKVHGPLSGWKYSVNGQYPMVSCAEYILKSNDEIVWEYVDE